mgnify:CR=1 FL=1
MIRILVTHLLLVLDMFFLNGIIFFVGQTCSNFMIVNLPSALDFLGSAERLLFV